jgi:hypothetical protein
VPHRALFESSDLYWIAMIRKFQGGGGAECSVARTKVERRLRQRVTRVARRWRLSSRDDYSPIAALFRDSRLQVRGKTRGITTPGGGGPGDDQVIYTKRFAEEQSTNVLHARSNAELSRNE